MLGIEKKFVNSEQHGQKNLGIVERLLGRISLRDVTRVLEIGCGVGIVSAHLASQYNMNVVGIDLDPEQIAIANTHNKENQDLRFFEADATKLPFESGGFDMVLSIYVLHHIGNWSKTLEEINRVLKPNGYLVLHDIASSRLVTEILNGIDRDAGCHTIRDMVCSLERNKFVTIHKEEPRGIVMKDYSIVLQKGTQCLTASGAAIGPAPEAVGRGVD